ncbi:hybrid sensor histidine kinase/response regulator [Anabaena cylindrica FACHB-243]|uniref:histidine kinase n=1 Tax=Anabaena cylindrica (strain ATCC 27899 / PCC 7122) TaxID=272123 RepID=K9ZFK8_ANACC|nr:MULTISPECIES: hybrid sensor histidine kinase/response regulator [Anabaena]AFZ57362.1 response regulator receiver sensor signal transduction histidine kinase [Anabaena cylindrica PCC 7122]MBD2421043.1 hybrid sensor histidine kinase/response regulator [Anabaena cylindrica FACHB-243]MBY5280747.1 hybrid sensor histidine kinase/response regulator [Anabaena sp. CCAP 1446/1C]MBY5306386.1 hybrid sensor histidine kinase/response regulator [Anabaena sp. CCAP 1446/1C]MCM2405795.1 hybrid sensor histidi
MSVVKSDKVNRILAVDDTRDNLILVQTILESEGYEIDLVSDGATALQKILQSPPDLILLDVMMPGMDGYEVTRRIRHHADLSYIPILLITAFHESSVVEGLDAGADDFIRKPFDTDELLARVRSLLRLKHSIDEQQKMTRQREDFVSRLTHDLRTPLVAADRMLDLFQQETFCKISPEMKQAISVMIRSNQNLMQMVNTLLEVYRFEAGKKTLNLEKCNLQEIAEEVISELTPLANEKKLTLKLDTHQLNQLGNYAGIIIGDRLELRRVLNNLIANAIKFTDTGGVEIRILETLSTKTKQSGILIEVADTGYGISPEDQATVFERFRQGRNKRSGSGLGLHLSQRIVEAHGGKIELSSELSKGSIFTVRLPKEN